MCASWFQGQVCISTVGQRPWARAEMGAFTLLFRINQGDAGQVPKFTPSFRWANTRTGAVMQKREEGLKRMQTISIVFCPPTPTPTHPL